jgi:hypothetical protein
VQIYSKSVKPNDFQLDKKGQNILLNGIKDALYIQIHDFAKRILGMLVESSAPGGTSVCKQNINVICVFGNFFDQALNLRDLAAVCWDGDGNRAGSFVGQCVQGCTSFLASLCFSGCDEYF